MYRRTVTTCDSLTLNAAIAFLPREPLCRLVFVRPFRRIRFDQSQHVGDGRRRLELRQNMDVIVDPADLELHAAFGANDAADVLVKFLLQIRP